MAAAGGDCAVYVSCAGSGELLVFRLDAATGTLAPLQSLAVGGLLMPLALGRDRRFLYAARRSPPLEVLSFAVSADDGRLTALGAAPLPHSMAHLSVDRTGRFLFSASYGGDLVAVGGIDEAGVAGAAQQIVTTEPKAHAVLADPSNRFVLSTCLGGGVLRQFRFDAATGRLTPNDPPTFAPHPGASPRHFVFSPDGRFVYLLGELDGMVDVLAFDAATGQLRALQTISSLPPGFEGEPWASDIHLTPDGRFLFCSERRSSVIGGFRIDSASGRLDLLGHTPTEAPPRGFGITPDGRHLVVAGEASNHLAVLAVDARHGGLRPCSRCPAGIGPNAVQIVALRG